MMSWLGGGGMLKREGGEGWLMDILWSRVRVWGMFEVNFGVVKWKFWSCIALDVVLQYRWVNSISKDYLRFLILSFWCYQIK